MESNFQEDKDYQDAINLLEVIEDTVNTFVMKIEYQERKFGT